MHPLDQQVARRLTWYYILALHVVALLTIGGLFFIRHTIHQHNDDGRVLNVAGRQRMLSQRLTKLALLRVEKIPSSDTLLYDSLLHTWSISQQQLSKGVLQMEKPYQVRKSPQLERMFQQLEPTFVSLHGSLQAIDRPPVSGRSEAMENVLRQEPRYVQQMNDIVFQFDAESYARVNTLERMEWWLAAATLLTLILEGLFVFRPVVSHTQRIIRRLTQSESDLQAANTQLAATNLELQQTQAKVLQLTKERYQSQRMQDQIRSAALMEGQEEERRRFARELHDGIGQMLTGLKLHAGVLRKIPFPEEKQKQRVQELSDYIQEIIQTTRQISYNLMPTLLEDYGLGAALQLLVEQLAASASPTITFHRTGEEKRLLPAQEIGLYRIAQEAITNAIKHAEARQITVRFHTDKKGVNLSVEDDGKGFKKSSRTPTSGLGNMQTRAELLKASFELKSSPEKGTRIRVTLPS